AGENFQLLTASTIRPVNGAVSRNGLIPLIPPFASSETSSRTSPPPTTSEFTARVGTRPLSNSAGVSAPVLTTTAMAIRSASFIVIGYDPSRAADDQQIRDRLTAREIEFSLFGGFKCRDSAQPPSPCCPSLS